MTNPPALIKNQEFGKIIRFARGPLLLIQPLPERFRPFFQLR
jgi:hypothetical protein